MTFVAVGFTACKKTEIIPLEKVSKNRILTYSVTNGANTLQGAVDNIDSTITVYLPYYSGIDHLVPEITLEEGASLIDAAGNKINLDGGVEPVPVTTKDYTYRVLGDDASVRKYKLIIGLQPYAPKLVAGYLYDYTNKKIDDVSSIDKVLGGQVYIMGNFESTSTNIKFTATHRKSGRVVNDLLKTLSVSTDAAGYYTALVQTSIEADTGYYDIRMEQQGRTADLPAIRLILRKPYFGSLSTIQSTLHVGDTVKFAVKTGNTHDPYNGVNAGLKRVYMKFNKSKLLARPATLPESMMDTPIELKVVKNTRSEVWVIFPENIPVGTYQGNQSNGVSIDTGYIIYYAGTEFYFDFEDWTGWGNNNLLGLASTLYVLPK
jgi:hypothetical protein